MCTFCKIVIAVTVAVSLSMLLIAGHAAPGISAVGPAQAETTSASILASASFTPTHWIYLPVVTSCCASSARRVNAPHFDGDIPFPETAIFWFGRVTPSEDYADVRVGYNDAELYIYLAAFDRRLWYDPSPAPNNLTQWDAATLYLKLTGNSGGAPDADSYRFDAGFYQGENASRYEAAYRGNGSGWTSAAIPFYTLPGWRGDALNNDGDDRGWTMTFRIPFADLGLSGPPPQGEIWGLAMALHNRDDASGSPIADKTWPETMRADEPQTFGQLAFGLPTYSPPPATTGGTVTIRHKLNGAVVPDAAVGGGSVCGEGLDFWTQWGNANYAGRSDFNIQNQSDIADWPCFSKYYVTFPLDTVPSGKVIISATLTLHQMGGAGGPDQAKDSLIQVLTVADDWNEATLTWNNAPQAAENVSRAWVRPVTNFPGWPGIPYVWDVSYAVSKAYAGGQPLRLALYSADSDYHSGKYFVSSDTGDWNEQGRPTLQVRWGNP